MSAREKLIRLARENTPDYGNTTPCDPETGFMFMGHGEYIAHVGKLLDEYAHELAEEQRAYARAVGVPLENGDYVATGDVIDLIDPQERRVGSEESTP